MIYKFYWLHKLIYVRKMEIQLLSHLGAQKKIPKKIDLVKRKNNIKNTAQNYQDDRNPSNCDMLILR